MRGLAEDSAAGSAEDSAAGSDLTVDLDLTAASDAGAAAALDGASVGALDGDSDSAGAVGGIRGGGAARTGARHTRIIRIGRLTTTPIRTPTIRLLMARRTASPTAIILATRHSTVQPRTTGTPART